MILAKVNVFAAGNGISDATDVSLGTQYGGTLTDTNTVDYYRFEVKSSGRVRLTAQAGMKRVYYKLYDGTGEELRSEEPIWDNTTQLISSDYYEDVIKGTYYFVVKEYYASSRGGEIRE